MEAADAGLSVEETAPSQPRLLPRLVLLSSLLGLVGFAVGEVLSLLLTDYVSLSSSSASYYFDLVVFVEIAYFPLAVFALFYAFGRVAPPLEKDYSRVALSIFVGILVIQLFIEPFYALVGAYDSAEYSLAGSVVSLLGTALQYCAIYTLVGFSALLLSYLRRSRDVEASGPAVPRGSLPGWISVASLLTLVSYTVGGLAVAGLAYATNPVLENPSYGKLAFLQQVFPPPAYGALLPWSTVVFEYAIPFLFFLWIGSRLDLGMGRLRSVATQAAIWGIPVALIGSILFSIAYSPGIGNALSDLSSDLSSLTGPLYAVSLAISVMYFAMLAVAGVSVGHFRRQSRLGTLKTQPDEHGGAKDNVPEATTPTAVG